jgi:hypothetical protein
VEFGVYKDDSLNRLARLMPERRVRALALLTCRDERRRYVRMLPIARMNCTGTDFGRNHGDALLLGVAFAFGEEVAKLDQLLSLLPGKPHRPFDAGLHQKVLKLRSLPQPDSSAPRSRRR